MKGLYQRRLGHRGFPSDDEVMDGRGLCIADISRQLQCTAFAQAESFETESLGRNQPWELRGSWQNLGTS